MTPPPKAVTRGGPIQQVMIGPVFAKPFSCTEHPEGQLEFAGDALGTDCFIVGGLNGSWGFSKAYRCDGAVNDDWYGWHEDVLAPFDGVIEGIYLNPSVNVPGTMGRPPASIIRFRRSDGLIVVYSHITDPRVTLGERVHQGQVVAKVGNNGTARNPHIHIGAYKGATPYQIRWDLRRGEIGIGEGAKRNSYKPGPRLVGVSDVGPAFEQ